MLTAAHGRHPEPRSGCGRHPESRSGCGRHPESRSDERIAVHPRLLRPWRESDPFTRFARSGWPARANRRSSRST